MDVVFKDNKFMLNQLHDVQRDPAIILDNAVIVGENDGKQKTNDGNYLFGWILGIILIILIGIAIVWLIRSRKTRNFRKW